MSLFDDIIKALPENTILRERARILVEENESLKQEVASLKDDLHEKDVKIAALQKVVDQFTQPDDLDETELGLLQTIANLEDAYGEVIASQSSLQKQRLEYHLKNLQDADYLRVGIIDRRLGLLYRLTQKARELLIKRGLL